MKKTIISIVICLAVLLTGMRIAIAAMDTDGKMSDDKFTHVTAPNQQEAQENYAFTIEEYVPPVIDGTNVALTGKVSASGFNDVYDPVNVNDGDRGTYWEGSPDAGENAVTVNLENSCSIHTVVVALNPGAIWSKRTQTMTISISEDGQSFTELKPSADYNFDPKTGNQVVVDFDEVTAKYVRVAISKNTGAVGGQIAELEVYSND